MLKLTYLLFEDPDRPGADLREVLLGDVAPALRGDGATDITVLVHDEAVAAGAPEWKRPLPVRALVSLWAETAEERTGWEATLAGAVPEMAGYLVSESRPLVAPAVPGRRSEGMNQVTCISRRPDLSHDEFLRIWFEDHRRVAIDTQSTFGYVRDEIVRPVTDGAPPWDGVVTETFPIEALTDPKVFFAASSDEQLGDHLAAMVSSTDRFLDYDTLEYTHMSCYPLG